MNIPEARLKLAVELDELGGKDCHPLDQFITPDGRMQSEAYDVVDELTEIASQALSWCQKYEKLLMAIDRLTIQTVIFDDEAIERVRYLLDSFPEV